MVYSQPKNKFKTRYLYIIEKGPKYAVFLYNQQNLILQKSNDFHRFSTDLESCKSFKKIYVNCKLNSLQAFILYFTLFIYFSFAIFTRCTKIKLMPNIMFYSTMFAIVINTIFS